MDICLKEFIFEIFINENGLQQTSKMLLELLQAVLFYYVLDANMWAL